MLPVRPTMLSTWPNQIAVGRLVLALTSFNPRGAPSLRRALNRDQSCPGYLSIVQILLSATILRDFEHDCI